MKARTIAPAALVLTVAVAVILLSSSGTNTHRLFVIVPDATDALAGQDIRAAGQRVGEIASITPIDRGRAVRLELAIDGSAWPLPGGTRFALREGGTISYSNRYIALTKAPGPATPLTEGQTLPASAFTVPVEFDQLIGTFTPRVRSDLKAFLQNGGVALHAASPALRHALSAAPPALTQADAVLRDLNADESALNTLVTSTDRVINAADTANPGVGQLIGAAATTFAAIGSQSHALQVALTHAAPTLTGARTVLHHASRTLSTARDLLGTLGPGVEQARRLATPLSDALTTLVHVGPDAIATLTTAHDAAPQLDALLSKVTTLMPEIGSIGRQSVTQLQCVRPYTPDIVAFFSNWADWLSYTDGKDRYGLANAESLLPASNNAETYTPGQAAKLFPGLSYGFPRPPGYNAGQPWFLPQCGAGPAALDPSKDPEAKSGG